MPDPTPNIVSSCAGPPLRVLVVGADGFVGRAVSAALVRRGHRVIAAVRGRIGGRSPLAAPEVIRAEISSDGRQSWAPRLAGVDAVINVAGAVGGALEALHAAGPAELFIACASAGIGRVVQVSALGAGDHPESPFLASKARGDAALLSLARGRPGWHVVRPSVVIGPGGKSTAAFLALAAAPRPIRLGAGTWRLQPIHVDDLVDLLCGLAEGAAAPALVEAVGRDVLTTDEVTAMLRAWLRLAPARPVAVPAAALRAGAALRALLYDSSGSELLRLLAAGNVASGPRAAGLHRGRSLAEALALRPAHRAERVAARLAWAAPALLAALAAVWLGSGAASLQVDGARADALLGGLGLVGPLGRAVTAAGAGVDLALGAALLLPRLRRPALKAQLAVMALYTALGTAALPALWLDPFGPFLKNAAVAAAAAALLAMEG